MPGTAAAQGSDEVPKTHHCDGAIRSHAAETLAEAVQERTRGSWLKNTARHSNEVMTRKILILTPNVELSGERNRG
jgi:hypothetical protein